MLKRFPLSTLTSSIVAALWLAGCNSGGANTPPVVDAGLDRVALAGSDVTLVATASDNGAIASYSWVQTSGSSVVLAGANSPEVSFQAVTASERLEFQVTVVDDQGASQTDSAVVQVYTPSPLNDTGLTVGGNYPTGINATCIGETIEQQDCSHGRDAANSDNSDGHGGFSFTKISATGDVLAADAVEWACVLDNTTGLMWEVKTAENKDELYTHKEALMSYPLSVNNGGLCGYQDWFLPARSQLLSLVNYERQEPAIDTAYFPNTLASTYWSSRLTTGADAGGSGDAWNVDFSYGSVFGNEFVRKLSVRLVRQHN